MRMSLIGLRGTAKRLSNEGNILNMLMDTDKAKLTIKSDQKKRKIEEIINSMYVPYSKGEAYYYYNPTRREVIVIIPIKRAKLSVGKACRELRNKLKEVLPEWHIEVWGELTSPQFWGIPMKYLANVKLRKRKR